MKITDFMRIFSSERRIEVLDALMRQETKDEIKKHIPSSTYAFTVNYLKKVGFVREADGDVSLTDRGHANLVIFERFKESINTLRLLYKAFPDHSIAFPDEFALRLCEICDAEVIVSEPSDILKPHRVFTDYLKNTREIYGVSPILFPDYPEFFQGLAESVDTISLVVTQDVFDIVSTYPLGNYDNLEIYLAPKSPGIAATVTDTFLSIGFFYKSGSYDFTRDLIAVSPEAIKFGKDLIHYYRTQSRRIV
ncbi:transcriptional regulator FilR1 domain-containing protein [Methanoculleus sp.]|uniref:helix-turn-helix transcriptional regulator n=1 Tax=Methanoculleus sp. TaxID=90427 RepID=UPI002600C423|nr:transcriptional regulator FilR1 domain-containing protein [Methanoculleus sp.]